MQHPQHLKQHTINDIKQLIKSQPTQTLLIQQVHQIFPQMLSVIVIYQKLFIKFRHKPSNSVLHVGENDSSLYMLKINRSFPLENSVRLYLLDGCYQPKIFDTRDLVHEVLGDAWGYKNVLRDVVEKIPMFEEKMAKRNENYLALQRTGMFLLGDVFVYNELEEHTSLTLFVDKNNTTNNILNAVSETHLLTFQKVVKKVFKTKEQEEYEMKSKTLYGKKFILSKFCDLQCIESMQVSLQAKEISLNVLKYRSIRSFNEFDATCKKIVFNDEESLKLFVRIVLKNLPKYQPTKLSFLPAYDKTSPQFKQDVAIQKIIEMNELQARLQARSSQMSKVNVQNSRKQQIVNRLNKSYQKMIEYYSARANPYYLVYVSKLNWLYQRYFVGAMGREGSLKGSLKGEKSLDDGLEKDFGDLKNQGENGESKQSKIKFVKSLTASY